MNSGGEGELLTTGPTVGLLLPQAGDLRRRKSGKEAREVKVEKVKIWKNGKGRY